MPPDDTTTGAMPGSGATPGQAGPTGTTTPSVGAMPPTQPPATPPATVDEALGDAGKRAIQAERARAETAEREREALRTRVAELESATQTDQEKALSEARKEATKEATARWQAHIRATEIKSRLRAAGIANERTIAAVAADPAFSSLKVNDQGEVEGLAAAVEAFRKEAPELFGGGTAEPTRGVQASDQSRTKNLQDSVTEAVAKQFSRT